MVSLPNYLRNSPETQDSLRKIEKREQAKKIDRHTPVGPEAQTLPRDVWGRATIPHDFEIKTAEIVALRAQVELLTELVAKLAGHSANTLTDAASTLAKLKT